MSNFSKWQSRGVKYMQINDAKNPCQICKKTGSLKCKGWFEDVQQGEWSALKQLYCFLNGHLTTACRPCNHPLGRALTKSRVCKREIQQPLREQSIDFEEKQDCTQFSLSLWISIVCVVCIFYKTTINVNINIKIEYFKVFSLSFWWSCPQRSSLWWLRNSQKCLRSHIGL